MAGKPGDDGELRGAAVDCDAGRRLGCQVFCCRLLVRLAPDERPPGANGLAAKGYVDKDAHGYCVHFDRATGLCRNWERRPRVCREYDCNYDPLLQAALRCKFDNLVGLVKAASRMFIPREQHRSVPYRSANAPRKASTPDEGQPGDA